MMFDVFFRMVEAGLAGLPYSEIVFAFVFAFMVFNIVALFGAFGGLLERKVIARIHSRIGPVYTGWHGILQTIADLLKLLRKELLFAKGSDRFLFKIAPILLVVPEFLTFIFLPIGSYVFLQNEYSLLFVIALLGISPVAILIGSWASNSKFATLGGLRAAGMMMSYEVLVVVAAASIALHAGTFDIVKIVEFQSRGSWFVFVQPLAFVLFLIGIIASVERNPFDLVEAESELVAGWKTEYGGVYYAFTLLAEYIKLLASGFLFAMLFLGGWAGPLGDVGFVIKVLLFVVLMFYVRATAMRLRMDQIFSKVWRSLIPLALLNFVITVGILRMLGGV